MAPTNVTLEQLIASVVQQVPDGALDQLAEAVRSADDISTLGDHLIGHFVDRARESGASWTQIGGQLGVSKQAAQQRYVPRAADAEGLAVFARYTDRARQAVLAARQAALEHRHNYIGTEHLLIGLCQDPAGVSAMVLSKLAGSADQVVQATMAALGPASPDQVRNPAFTPKARQTFKAATDAALGLGHNYIGTEHLLLALLDGDGLAARVLAEQGVTFDAARAEVVEFLTGYLAAKATERDHKRAQDK
jgi:hypothetical protein